MYVPKHFDLPEVAACHAIIRDHAFASLVTVTAEGLPTATWLPFLLDAGRGPNGTLLGHMARANPQWRDFDSGKPVLAMFQGAHAYISPRWYQAHPSVPTWNYQVVHAYGTPTLIEDEAAVRALLGRLSQTYEAGAPKPWRMDTLPEAYLAGMTRAIVAFEIPIDRLIGKAKLSQNRNAADRAGVVKGLEAEGDAESLAMARLIEV